MAIGGATRSPAAVAVSARALVGVGRDMADPFPPAGGGKVLVMWSENRRWHEDAGAARQGSAALSAPAQ